MSTTSPPRPSSRDWILPGLLLVLLLWAFFPTLLEMGELWFNDSRYSHGWLVPLFSAYLIWTQRDKLLVSGLSPSWWGIPILLLGLAIAFTGTYIYFDWLNSVGLVVAFTGLVLTFIGWRGLALTWPALAFLLFMIPLPHFLAIALGQPLQRIATIASTWSLQTLGFAAFSEGNIIRMGSVHIGVVEACSGLSMLMIFFALCTAVAILMPRPLWERLLIVLAAIPIALLSNITRIVVTGMLHKLVGKQLADVVFHDLAGWLMMPLALGLLWLGYKLFNWAFPIRSGSEDDPLDLYLPSQA